MSDQQNSFFQQNSYHPPYKERLTGKRAWVYFAVGLIYGGISVLLAYGFGLTRGDLALTAAILAYGVMGGFILFYIKDTLDRKRRSVKTLQEIIDKSPAARLITDRNGDTVYYNRKFSDMMPGFQSPTLDNFAEVFSNARKMRSSLERIKERALGGEEGSLETTAIINDVISTLQISAFPLTAPAHHVQWRFDNITEVRQLSQDLQNEREKLLDFTDKAPVGFFSVNEEGFFTFANSVFEKWLATEDNEIIESAKLHDFLFDVPEKAEPYEVFENEGDYQTGELSMMGKDGRIFKAAITHSIVREDNGKVRTRSVVYDLSSEQQIEAALRETQDSFVRLFEEAPVGICLLARDGAIDAANHSFTAYFNKKTPDVTHQLFTDFIAPADQDMVSKWIENLFSSKQKNATIEAHLNSQDETIVQIYGRKFRGGDSMVLHFIDLTEQKSLEQQFTQSQKMQAIGQLAGGVAHDFNNLLTAMIGFCDLLLLRHKPGHPSFSDLMQIKQNANRAANLVRQLLAFSRQQTLQPKVLDITEVLSEVSHLIRRLIGAQIQLNIEHNSSEPELIKVDQGQLEQVLINLAVNARDAMGGKGQLNIRTSISEIHEEVELANTNDILPPGQWVKVEIEDNGSGIPDDIISRIFEPFFTTKELGSGTGLGLSTVHGIIHQTGGFLAVDTEVGRGTVFSIYIPQYERTEEDAPKPVTEQKAEADLTGSAKILLVEDEDAVRSFSARALSNKGYEVIEAINGVDALDKLGDDKPALELIITDVVMPEMDGPTLIEKLREHYTDVKIIFMSGYTEDRLKEQFGERVHFLPKPFTLKQLATKVKDVLEG